MSEPGRAEPRDRWLESARDLLKPPKLTPVELEAYLERSRRRVTERFRSGVPLGITVALVIAFLWSAEVSDPAKRTWMLVGGLVAAAALVLYVPLCSLRVFRARPNALILPVSMVIAGVVAVVATVAGGFDSVAAALVLIIWIYGSVLAPLPPRSFLIDVLTQYAIITGGIWVGTTPDTVPWMYLTLTMGGLGLAVLGVFIRENSDRRSFTAHRRLDEAHGLLAESREELEQLNQGLEARVDEQLRDIRSHAQQVETLNAQLQQRVQERSRELAVALAKLGDPTQRRDELLEPGTVVGERAKVIRLLGAGGMGEVYLAEDLVTGENVALKVIHARDDVQQKDLHRMFAEAAAAAAISHPGVVKPLHVDVSADGNIYLLSELVRGETLHEKLSRGEVLDPGEAARVGHILATALAAAHDQGVVHRDVKPHNVMLTASSPGVKLLDFGISKSGDEVFKTAVTVGGQLLGTPAYMAPEQFANPSAVGAAADVYSLGLLLYEVVAGRGPFEFENALQAVAAHTLEDPVPLQERQRAAPAELCEVVERCLAKDPAHRLSAQEVADRLGELANRLNAPSATTLAPPLSTVAVSS